MRSINKPTPHISSIPVVLKVAVFASTPTAMTQRLTRHDWTVFSVTTARWRNNLSNNAAWKETFRKQLELSAIGGMRVCVRLLIKLLVRVRQETFSDYFSHMDLQPSLGTWVVWIRFSSSPSFRSFYLTLTSLTVPAPKTHSPQNDAATAMLPFKKAQRKLFLIVREYFRCSDTLELSPWSLELSQKHPWPLSHVMPDGQPEEESWLFHSVYTMICIVHFQTSYRNTYLFPNHVQSCDFKQQGTPVNVEKSQRWTVWNVFRLHCKSLLCCFLLRAK